MLSFFTKKKTASTPSDKTKSNDLPETGKKNGLLKPVQVPVSFLKQLSPIAQLLEEKELRQLPIKTASFSPGSILFNRGFDVDALAYIVRGSVFMEASNGSGQEITAGTLKAMFPLSAGPFHQLTAIAKTPVTLIYAPLSILKLEHSKINPLQNKWQGNERLLNNPFYAVFEDAYRCGEFAIPSLPDIAFKLRRVTEQNASIADVVKIINLDPAISAKLIQVVNSPFYRTLNPITSCHGAVNRLGLATTRSLATAISMQNLFKGKKPAIKKRIRESWLQSVRVSGISHTLARHTGKIAPEEALLAGLLHTIGTLPLLMFADSLSGELYTPEDIDLCITELQGALGSLILERWGFPDHFAKVPIQTSQWFENTGPDLTLGDIVLLAKFHHLLSETGGADLPLINTLPAYQKLNDQLLTPELSLQMLQDSKQQILEAIKFFAM